MSWNLNLGQKGLLLVVVPVIFELIFVSILFLLLRQAEYEVWRETHSKAVIAECNDIWRLCYESGMSLFAFSGTRQETLLERFSNSESQLASRLETLQILTDRSKDESSLFEKVDKHAQKVRLTLKSTRSALMNTNTYEVAPVIRALKKEFENTGPLLAEDLNALTHYEKRMAEDSPKEQERTRFTVLVCLAAGLLLSSILALWLARYFNREATHRISLLVDNTRRLSERRPLNPLIQGGDEIAQLDRVFHKMADELEISARRKQELMSMVSHDLRSPLMAVEITLGSISDGVYGEVPQNLADPLTKSRKNTLRLIELINDLLDIEKLESGQLSMHLRSCTMSSIFDRSFDAIAAIAEQKSIDIEMQDDEIRLEADPDRLCQVLINLLSNAIKFSEANSCVTVKAELTDTDEIEVSVTDSGRGIPADMQAGIFDRFRQVRSEDGQRGKGSGLGLPIAKAIVEGHGGCIGVETKLEKGSRFWFRIPKASKQEGEAKNGKAEESAASDEFQTQEPTEPGAP